MADTEPEGIEAAAEVHGGFDLHAPAQVHLVAGRSGEVHSPVGVVWRIERGLEFKPTAHVSEIEGAIIFF